MIKILFVILKKKKYAAIAVISAVILAALSYYLTVVNVYQYSILIYAEMSGVLFTVISLLFSLIIAILFGVYLSLLFFRRDVVKARAAANKAVSSVGTVSGIVAAGCPACGAPLLGFLGFPLGLFSLPFRGIELKFLSIIFLILGIFLIFKNIKKNLVCATDL